MGASEGALNKRVALCHKHDKNVIAAAGSPVEIPGATSKPDAGNACEGVSIFSSFIGEPKSDHLEMFQESRSDLEQVLTSFGAFCELMTLRLAADEDAVAAEGFNASSPGTTSRPRNHPSE